MLPGLGRNESIEINYLINEALFQKQTNRKSYSWKFYTLKDSVLTLYVCYFSRYLGIYIHKMLFYNIDTPQVSVFEQKYSAFML